MLAHMIYDGAKV